MRLFKSSDKAIKIPADMWQGIQVKKKIASSYSAKSFAVGSPEISRITFPNQQTVTPATNGEFSIIWSLSVEPIESSEYILFTIPEGTAYVWFNVDGGGSDPGAGGLGIEITLTSLEAGIEGAVSGYMETAMEMTGYFSVELSGVDNQIMTITPTSAGGGCSIEDPMAFFPDSIFTTVSGGSNGSTTTHIAAGEWWGLSSPITNYAFWYTIDGAGSDPSVGGRTSVGPIALTTGDSASTIASATRTAVNGVSGTPFSAAAGNPQVITNTSAGNTTNISFGSIGADVTIAIDQQGSSVIDLVNDQVAIASHGYITTIPVTLTTTGTLPSPLLTATTYYIIAVNSNTVAFAASAVNAGLGTKIDLTTTGTGTHTINP